MLIKSITNRTCLRRSFDYYNVMFFFHVSWLMRRKLLWLIICITKKVAEQFKIFPYEKKKVGGKKIPEDGNNEKAFSSRRIN